MSDQTYREAATRLRAALDVLGAPRGGCSCCGWVDARHREADAIRGRVLAGDDPGEVGLDYRFGLTGEQVLALTVAVLDADPHRHRITIGRAAGIDREVWAVLPAASGE